MCIVDGCNSVPAADPRCARWGIGDVCTQHFDDAADQIEACVPALDRTWAEDFARIAFLVANKPQVRDYFRMLSRQLVIRGGAHAGPDVVHETLQHFEKKTFFAKLHIVPLSILTPDDFFSFIRDGFVFDDFGAGYTHGAYTHRLHLFALNCAVTARFTSAAPGNQGWNHSALELFSKLGENVTRVRCDLDIAGMQVQTGNLWGALFDQQGRGEHFNHADEVHWDVRFGPMGLGALGAQIIEIQREWGSRKWALERMALLDAYKTERSNLPWYRQKPTDRQLVQRVDRENEAHRRTLVGGRATAVGDRAVFGGVHVISVTATKETEMLRSGRWQRGRAGALIPVGKNMNEAATIGIRKTASRVVFAH